MSTIRVALVDDHPVVLAGIRSLLEASPDIALAGEAATAADGLRLIETTCPDIAVIDLSLPDLGGLELARQLARSAPEVKLLALTVHEDRAYVQPLLQAGARGYLVRLAKTGEIPL